MHIIKGSSALLILVWLVHAPGINLHDWIPVSSKSQSTFEGRIQPNGIWYYQIRKESHKNATSSSASFAIAIKNTSRSSSLEFQFRHFEESTPSLSKFESWKLCLEELQKPNKDTLAGQIPKYVCLNMTLSKTDALDDKFEATIIYYRELEYSHFNLHKRTITSLQRENGIERKQITLRAPFGLTLIREEISTKNKDDSISVTSFWRTVGPSNQTSSVKFTSKEVNRNPYHEFEEITKASLSAKDPSDDFTESTKESTTEAGYCANSVLESACKVKHGNLDPGTITNSSEYEVDTMTRFHEVNQTLSSDFFLIYSNMTVDVTNDGHQIIWIYQRFNLHFCPAIGWSLKQIFNFSSSFSGWEYVVSEWQWGNMIVQGLWGTSFFQNYKKTISFSFDQDIPLPNTNIILDFEEYQSFVVKFICPALGSSVIFSLRVHLLGFTLHVKEQDEFAGDGGKNTLLLIEGIIDDIYITIRPNAEIERLRRIAKMVDDVARKVISHPKFCGSMAKKLTIKDFLLHLLGYKESEKYWEDMKNQVKQFAEILDTLTAMDELQTLRERLLQYVFTDGSFNVWTCCNHIWHLFEELNIIETIPDNEEIRINIKIMQQWIGKVTVRI